MIDIKEQLKQAYDKDAQRRDSGYIDQWKVDIRQSFLDRLHNEQKELLLELGSGPGRDALFFKENGLDVLATDLSSVMIERCVEKGLNAKVIDMYNLSSLNLSFDAIFSLNVLMHVLPKELGVVLESIYNVLNKDGLFYFGVRGGQDLEETVVDDTKMNLPRFFSYLSDKSLLSAVSDLFDIVSFDKIDISNKKGLYFQSLTLRKKR